MDNSSRMIVPAIKPLLLSGPELEELHLRYAKRKCRHDLDKLFRVHAPWSILLARRFSVHPNHAKDLQAAAFRGLLKALDRYDPSIGKFSTFAYWWILKFILKEREFDQNLVRIPLTLVRRHRRIRQLVGAGLTLRQISKKINIPVSAVETLYNLYDHPHCVPLGDGPADGSILPPNTVLAAVEKENALRETLAVSLKDLPQRWRLAVSLRFRNTGQRSFLEIGRRMKCSPESARRYYMAGLSRLKKRLTHGESLD
jgi:DNA-directed RNA polymerase sigma subunit (sigma70/sigma32)